MRATLLLAIALVATLFIGQSNGQSLSCQQMSALCGQYFGWDAWIMMCISWIESRWEPSAYNPSGATGLWQIMQPLWCSACDCASLTDPNGNAQCALTILQSQGLAAWNPDPSTCVGWYNNHDAPFPSCAALDRLAQNATRGIIGKINSLDKKVIERSQ